MHEVEEGEIDPEAGLQEIKELIEAAEGEEDQEDGDHAGEEELPEMVLAMSREGRRRADGRRGGDRGD